MSRTARFGVPGLSRDEKTGRLRFDFRHEGVRHTRTYPPGTSLTAAKADASKRYTAIMQGEAERPKERATREKKDADERRTIKDLAPEIVKAFDAEPTRAGHEKSPATKADFLSNVMGARTSKRGVRPNAEGGAIVRHLGHLRPSEVTVPILDAMIATLRSEKKSNRTIQCVARELRTFLRLCRAKGFDPDLRGNVVRDALADRLIRLPGTPRSEPVFLAVDDARALLAHPDIPEVRRVRYVLALLCGLRDGELAGLTWGAVDLEARTLEVRQTFAMYGGLRRPKTQAGVRTVPLHADAVRILRSWQAHTKGQADAYVFPGVRRPPSSDLLRRDLVTAGVTPPDGLVFHGTRKAFASWCEAAGVPHEVIERLVGHVLSSTLGRHYAAGDLATLRQAVDRLPSILPTPVPHLRAVG